MKYVILFFRKRGGGMLVVLSVLALFVFLAYKATRREVYHGDRSNVLEVALLLVQHHDWVVEDIDELYGPEAVSVDFRRISRSNSVVTLQLMQGDENFERMRGLRFGSRVKFLGRVVGQPGVAMKNPSRYVELVHVSVRSNSSRF